MIKRVLHPGKIDLNRSGGLYKYHTDGTLPKNGEVFVFGSNLAGIHGAGAAKVAAQKYGAVYGKGFGRMGQSYAIPTKNANIQTLELQSISKYIEFFKSYIKTVPEEEFFVTAIGCGLAGYNAEYIAPLFKNSNFNCNFPKQWKEYLE